MVQQPMATITDPILQHASAFARAALNGSTEHQGQVHAHLDHELSRYQSLSKRHDFLVSALEELDRQFLAHLDKAHPYDTTARANCGQRPRHARAKLMVEDRKQAIDEQRDPLFARSN